jgi:arabinofuranosyltransferase
LLSCGSRSAEVDKDPPSGDLTGAKVLRVFALLVFAVVLVRHAWVSDDAFITLRTVRNLLEGDGLRWNLHERVQGYTHPLWMLLLALFYAFFPDPIGATLLLSLGLSVATLYLVVFRLRLPAPAGLLALAVLISSKSFVDYSTSGLENPLTHFLSVLLVAQHLRGAAAEGDPAFEARRRAFRTAFLAGLMALNRLDSVLFALPFLVSAFWGLRSSLRVAGKILAAGFAPLLVWEFFAFVYYGFAFPNTAYAKLGSEIPSSLLRIQGFFYYLSQIEFDPTALVAMACALVLFAIQRERRLYALAFGILFYLAYIVWIGGDFMAGRFFALPLLASAQLLAHLLRERLARQDAVAYLPAAVVMAVGLLLTPHPTLGGNVEYTLPTNPISKNPWDERGVCDERAYYAPSSSLVHACRTAALPGDWRRARGQHISATAVEVVAQAGVAGFYAPPTAIMVDIFGLNDAFLARLPAADKVTWRVGHYDRPIPPGYLDSLKEGRNRIADPKLARFYDRIRLVVSGPIWSWQRWKEIVRLALGIEPPPPPPPSKSTRTLPARPSKVPTTPG